MAERAIELFLLPHVQDLHICEMLFQPLGLYLPDSSECILEAPIPVH